MEPAEQRTFRNADRARPLDVEATQPVVLDERPPHGTRAVVDRECVDRELVTPERLALRALHDLDGERDTIDAEVDRFTERRFGPERPEQAQRLGAILQLHGSDEPRDPEEVVSVHVADEDRNDPEAGPVAHHLALGALAAVEQKEVALALHGQTTDVAAHRGPRGGCS